MKPHQVAGSGVQIAGTTYLRASALARQIGVARTTLYRWRTDGHVPFGRRDRHRQVLFTLAEAEIVRDYADRLEPATVKRKTAAGRDPAVFWRKQ